MWHGDCRGRVIAALYWAARYAVNLRGVVASNSLLYVKDIGLSPSGKAKDFASFSHGFESR